ncbi:MATE family efflux transporter [Clostridium algidicarnis]|uniref:Probable multidrug resistance protein NorM n=1 Tax=Clostridium algidicarnis DSM 15099 TaxID=1121295 RepID=A0A2S6FXL8_9CLOT|nr:MATE family efflux transporter [Clostridium algidicarnis]PPK48269.1 putative MATE family efflux protein [Clostridium algidicarnis DSM 15099]
MNKKNDVLSVSLPIISQMVVYTFMSIFDMMMVGKYAGNKAVNILGLSNAMVTILINIIIINGISIGMISIISRYIGAKDSYKASLFSYNGIMIGMFMGLIITAITFLFGNQILHLMGARGDLLYITLSFSKINAVAMFFYIISSLINAMFIAYGYSYIPLLSSLIQFVTKIFLNYIFMFILFKNHININVVAISSLISYIAGFIFCICMVRKYRFKFNILFKNLKFSLSIAKEIIELSIPSSFEEAAYSISRLICTSIIMYSGSMYFSANEIANTIESISFMPGTSFGIATTTLVGIKIGERDIKEANRVAFECAFYALIMMCSFSLLFLFMPNFLVKFFVGKGDLKVAYLAGECLAIGAIEQPLIAVSLVFAGGLKGLGDTKTPFYISVFTAFFIRLPLIYYFLYILKYSIRAVWWITALQWGIDGVLMFICFKYKIFKRLTKY